jgi:hemoglobin
MITTDTSLYHRLGGEKVLREFVDKLYDFMDEFPAVEKVRKMHADDMSQARERLFMFLSGMLGGPPLYADAFGPPRLRRKHLQFKIGNQERDQWLFCAENAANQLQVDAAIREELMAQLVSMADHLRNQGGLQIGRPGGRDNHPLH